MTENRIPVSDPAFMRRAGRRMTISLVFVLILCTLFTVGGITLVVNGELPGLPFAVGGAVLQIGFIIIVVATLRVHRTLAGATIARSALLTARRVSAGIRRIAWATIVALILFGLVRLALVDDPWSIGTAGLISIALVLLASGSKKIGRAQDRSLKQSQ